MHRILVSIGCNKYDHCSSLASAEIDAERIFKTLTASGIGNYDPTRSKMLLSPTLEETERALNEALFSSGKVDTLTFYFAGHGSYRAASFFMCLKDTRPDRLSASAFPLADLFIKMGEAAPAHTDIILDACFSGGLVADLSVLLKPDLMGDAGTPSVTLLAMSARNEETLEDVDGGKATTALIDCVVGATFVHDSTAWLDLTDLGKKVSEKIGKQVQQTPVVWGLNLNTQSAFCRNPHYRANVDSTFKKWSPRVFIDAIDPLLKANVSAPREQLADVARLTGGILEKAYESKDKFQAVEVRATAIASLLEYCGETKLDEYVADAALKTALDVEATIRLACSAIQEDRFALLASGGGGLADLFYLPIRITKMLGWAGAAYHLRKHLNCDDRFDRDGLERFANLIIEHYSTSLVAMSDAQSPFVASALTAMHRLNLSESGEIIAGLLFNSIAACAGQVADSHLGSNKVLTYLIQRRNEEPKTNTALLARPTELLTVLLKSARLFSLEDEFDLGMSRFDHVTINAYFPDDYRFYSRTTIPGGVNACYRIGHDIWTIEELERSWPVQAHNSPDNSTIAVAAIVSSMLFNDRVAWFLFPRR